VEEQKAEIPDPQEQDGQEEETPLPMGPEVPAGCAELEGADPAGESPEELEPAGEGPEDGEESKGGADFPDEIAGMPTRNVVEALLFASSAPVNVARLAATAELEKAHVRKLIAELNEIYEQDGRAFQIFEVANGYQLMTRSEYFPFIQKLVKTKASDKLTQAGLETLAIIAYKQPVIRADIEAVRGVQTGPIIRSLLERRLVRVAGRDPRLGHPLLYETTKKFLEVFGLKSLKDLPTIEELKAF
jgi:segregation and condensation protein B